MTIRDAAAGSRSDSPRGFGRRSVHSLAVLHPARAGTDDERQNHGRRFEHAQR